MREGRNEDRPTLAGSVATNSAQLLLAARTACGKCGATRIDQQIGLEPTPEAYVATLVQAFAEVWRVLKPDAVLWLNLGDSYASGGTGRRDTSGDYADRRAATYGSGRGVGNGPREYQQRDVPPGLKPKDLVGIPWMAAFALRAAGWYLRSDVIWSKPNPMPESVTDRPTKAHEYIFLLTKNERYYYDADAISERLQTDPRENYPARSVVLGRGGIDCLEQVPGAQPQQRSSGGLPPRRSGNKARKLGDERGRPNSHLGGSIPWEGYTRNRRSVWTVATQPYAGAHFATFPEALIEPCILAGSRPGDLILDPFIGTGTVGQCSERLMRRWVGTDLSYQGLAKRRTRQRGLRLLDSTVPLQAHVVGE